jgi:hypothetical protein
MFLFHFGYLILHVCYCYCNNTGCGTHEICEGGYDHALYRFRMRPENYEYTRLILHRFEYTDFMQNRGEGYYLPSDVVKQDAMTYFVHSKAIFQTLGQSSLEDMLPSNGRLCCGDVCD